MLGRGNVEPCQRQLGPAALPDIDGALQLDNQGRFLGAAVEGAAGLVLEAQRQVGTGGRARLTPGAGQQRGIALQPSGVVELVAGADHQQAVAFVQQHGGAGTGGEVVGPRPGGEQVAQRGLPDVDDADALAQRCGTGGQCLDRAAARRDDKQLPLRAFNIAADMHDIERQLGDVDIDQFLDLPACGGLEFLRWHIGRVDLEDLVVVGVEQRDGFTGREAAGLVEQAPAQHPHRRSAGSGVGQHEGVALAGLAQQQALAVAARGPGPTHQKFSRW